MAMIPKVVGLVAAGAVAFAFGGKKAAASPAVKPSTHKPKKKSPEVTATTEKAIKAAMNNPAAMKAIIDQTAKSGDASKLWNLGRTILLNSQGKPAMQAVASHVLVQAVVLAAKTGQLGGLVATALANGDAAILSNAAQSAIKANPALASQLRALVDQLTRAAKPPSKPGGTRAPRTEDEKLDTKAAQAATAVVVDAIKKTEQVQKDPPQAPLPKGNVTTLPEVVITAAPPSASQVMSPQQAAAQDLTVYLNSISSKFTWPHEARFKEDKSIVGKAQAKMGLSADGKYGPGTARAIAALGIVPVPPYYWTAGKAQQQKNEYKAAIAKAAATFTDLDWSPALKGVDRS